MAQTIKIKRSTGSAAPSTIAAGELAYSKGSQTLYIGDPDTNNSNSALAIGPAIINNAGTASLVTGVTAAEIRSLISVDAAGTDNSTDVTLAGTPDYLTISDQEITLNQIDLAADVTGTLPVSNGGTGATTAAGARTALGVDPAGTDNSTDVTLVTTSHDYLSIAGQAITLGAINLSTDVTSTLAISNGGTGATTAAGARTALNVDVAGTDNSTDVTLGASVTDILSITGQAISGVDAGAADAVVGWDDSLGKLTYLPAAAVRTAINVDVAGTDNSTDVTLVTTSHDYLSIAGQAITLGAINLADDVSGTLAISNGGTGATTAAGARTALGVDPAGTDNSTDVTLAGTPNYLTLSGQQITLGLIDLATDVTGSLPIANGGTGSTTAAGARTALGLGALATLNSVNAATITDNSVGAAELNVTGNGTAGQALVSDGDGTMSWSTISVTDNNVNEANLRARLADLTENVTIGDATDVTVTTSGDLVVTGDLTVSGTTTTVNTETILLADNIITVNSNYTGSAPTENGGIEVERGTLANTAVRWNETNDRWEFTNDGSTYYNIPLSTEYTNNIGDITQVNITAGTGLSGTVNTTSGAHTQTLALDFSELTDKTTAITGTTEFILQDGSVESRKAASEIDLSVFNNDSGWTSNTGTVTSISVASPDGSISGTGTITTSGTFNLEVAVIDGGDYT